MEITILLPLLLSIATVFIVVAGIGLDLTIKKWLDLRRRLQNDRF